MSPHVKITARTFTIWILASLMNAALCAFYRSLINTNLEGLPIEAFFIFFISLFFSAPGFLIFWIILLIKLEKGIYDRALFRTALSVGFILAATTGLIGLRVFMPESSDRYVFVLFIILSAMASIMMHFRYFKKINN